MVEISAMFLSVKQVGRELGVSRQQAWRLVKSGRLPGRRVGRQLEVSRVNLDRFKCARRALGLQLAHPMLRRKERR